MIRAVLAAAAVVAGVVVLGVDVADVLNAGDGDVASDYDPTGSTLDYHAPDGFNADGRTDMVDPDAEDGDGFTGL